MTKLVSECCGGKHDRHRGRPLCNERHKAILEAATSLFMERGFGGTSMDAVAKEADVSKQTVYSHFSTKDNLFSSAITHKMEDYFPQGNFVIAEGGSIEEELTIVASQYANLLMSEDAMSVFRLLVSEAPKGSHLADIFWEAGPTVMLGRLVAFLQKWQERGALKIDNFEKAAIFIIHLLKGHYHYELSIGLIDHVSPEDLQASVRDSVAIFLKLYRA